VSAQSRVKPNVAEVAAKVIDGEAIIMNLSTGFYYSTDKVGAVIWELTGRGYSLNAIADVIVDRYGIDRERAGEDVQRLVAELLEENLVTVAEREFDDGAALPEPGEPVAYEPPVLLKHMDMTDMLALDPPMPDLGGGATCTE
jgi:Coenzyme PQQ synthesis protein D (PqqD)